MARDGSVGRLLSRAFSALVLLIVGAGLAELTTVLLQHRVVDELTGRVQPLQLANARLRGLVADGQRGLRGYLLTGDSALLDTYHVARSEYPLAVRQVRDLAGGRERDMVDAQVSRADAWWRLADGQRQAPPRSTVAASQDVAVGRPLYQDFAAASRRMDDSLADRAADLHRRSDRLSRLTVGMVATLTVAGAALGASLAVRVGRRITRPLGAVVDVLQKLRKGDTGARADPAAGPAEIRAVAAALNVQADASDRRRDTERDVARLRGDVRRLGYRIRGHLVVEDAITEAVRGLGELLRADHVLVRMAAGQSDVPPLASLHDEHAGGALAGPAACTVDWLAAGDVWATDDPAQAGDVRPPAAELAAWRRVGDGPMLTVAVSAADERIGALTLARDTGPPFTPVEIRLTEVVAADLGRGIHLARLYEREQQLVARLQELDTAKTDFMSTVSHELRTPLTSIAGYVELLLDAEAGELADPQARMLEVIARNTRRLRELIEDMLILSKIESGTFRTTKQPVDLAAVVEHAVTAVAPTADKASVGLHTAVTGPLHVPADAAQLDRMLTNLLSNAVKFTPADGTVAVAARVDGDQVVLRVADTGMGIPEAEQQGLFARFFRASNAIHLAIPGTGLGLAIVRTIVDNHGGTIDVSSTEGVGTTVTVRLPV